MLDFARTLSMPGLLRYLAWHATGKAGPVALQTRSGARFWLRPDTSENNDYGVAYEVFVHDYYRTPPEVDALRVQRVVDLGANVGMSVLHWLSSFPKCRVDAYEPHPGHLRQLRTNLELSGQGGRVDIHPHAAGARQRTGRFVSQGTSTSLLPHDALATGFDAEVVDVLAALAGTRVDVLKMDMEGGEYELLEDPRFAGLDIGAVVMEWHARDPASPDADRAWCEARFGAMGFEVRPVMSAGDHGMLWALRF